LCILGTKYTSETETEQLVSINEGLKKELEVIVQTIETQYARMKEEKKKELEHLKQRVDDDEEVRSKEMKLRMAQGKVNKMK
jgi:hypothetical protein